MVRSTTEVNRIVKKTVGFLKNHIQIDAAYLFGSYARGNPHAFSDIDLAFFSPTVNKMSIDQKITMLSKIAEKVGSNVEIHLYPKKCLKEAQSTNFYGHILKTGRKIL